MDTNLARHLMVEAQVRTNKVIEPRFLDVLRSLPREQFIPHDKAALAYADNAVEMEKGRFLLSPMLLARLIESANLSAGVNVLHIGTLLGYTPLLCGLMGATVTTVEASPNWAAPAQKLVKTHSLPDTKITLVQGTLAEGAAAYGQYDIILIDAGVEVIPHALIRQLKSTGRILAVEMLRDGYGRATEWRKNGDALSALPLFDAVAAVLPGFAKPPLFAL
jgi:protein-L-isoaspartate(D-aspartate) O-methyltransferase